MKKPNHAWILFERSGTFKKAKVNFLKWFFPLKPEIIIEDRRALGDFFKKPTQFFFVNCKAEFSLIPFVGPDKAFFLYGIYFVKQSFYIRRKRH